LNLVFDLGGVVVQWDPEAIIASVFSDPATGSKVRKGIFSHPDWLELDRGTLAREAAIERGAQRTGLPPADIERLLRAVPPSLVPFPDTVALLHRLKKEGHRLFCLSNMHFASIEHLEATHDFFALFDGWVISCRLQLCKPEAAIYEHLLRTYSLDPARTVFIDDVEVNVKAAAKLGMHAIRFENAAQCERELALLLARRTH
jgi:putative hydrolase of the HAD superfamily